MNIADYHALLRQHGCLVTGRLDDLELHHPLGSSITERIGIRGTRKTSSWLCLPLHREQHGRGYPGSIHANITAWEERNGTEAELIDHLSRVFNLPLWDLALADKQQQKERRQRRMGSSKVLKHSGKF